MSDRRGDGVPPTLLVLLGPTAVGKTAMALHLAERLGSVIVNADSRQIYRDIPVCTAAPTVAELKRVRHYFVGTHQLDQTFSAAQFEAQALDVIQAELAHRDVVLLSGGSMMYIDAVVRGIDDMPDVDPEVRRDVRRLYDEGGLEALLSRLRLLDPDYYARVDRRNTQRVLHAVEMCLTAGRPFSSFHTGQVKARPFRILQVGLRRERPELYRRIAQRVDQMLADGLEDEARRVLPWRGCNALNTVGMKEMMCYLDGACTLQEARDRIVHSTQVYSKKQMTWFRRNPDIEWFHPSQTGEIDQWIDRKLGF